MQLKHKVRIKVNNSLNKCDNSILFKRGYLRVSFLLNTPEKCGSMHKGPQFKTEDLGKNMFGF